MPCKDNGVEAPQTAFYNWFNSDLSHHRFASVSKKSFYRAPDFSSL
jgi:hypothetical protein